MNINEMMDALTEYGAYDTIINVLPNIAAASKERKHREYYYFSYSNNGFVTSESLKMSYADQTKNVTADCDAHTTCHTIIYMTNIANKVLRYKCYASALKNSRDEDVKQWCEKVVVPLLRLTRMSFIESINMMKQDEDIHEMIKNYDLTKLRKSRDRRIIELWLDDSHYVQSEKNINSEFSYKERNFVESSLDSIRAKFDAYNKGQEQPLSF